MKKSVDVLSLLKDTLILTAADAIIAAAVFFLFPV